MIRHPNPIFFFFLQRNGNYQMARVRESKEITT